MERCVECGGGGMIIMAILNAKQEAMDTIQRLPDGVDFDEIVYRLHVLNKIHQGLKDVEEGRLITTEELMREIGSFPR